MAVAGCRLLTVLVPAGLLVASALALSLLPVSPLLGISPQDEKYFAGAVIACRDGSKSFPRDRLNDDFCDCPDGTDEPGTSACPQSKFYCRNLGDTPCFLFSSRVNDRICDCCDGSDEYDGGIICPNTCIKDEHVLFNTSDGHDSTEMKLNYINTREMKSRVDTEDLIQKLKGLRVVTMIELISVICMATSCLFCRRTRSRRRRFSLRN